MPTNRLRTLVFAASCTLAPVASQGQEILLQFIDHKEYKQFAPFNTDYIGGFTDLVFRDGIILIAPCIGNGEPFITPPITNPPLCPLGTTGFIAQGDIDGDGIQDVGSFWSVSDIVPATAVEPGRPDKVRIVGAPPSGISQGLQNTNGDPASAFDVVDSSVIVWYDFIDPNPIRQFDVTLIDFFRDYVVPEDTVQEHYFDVAWGTYVFEFPRLDNPDIPVGFSVTHNVAPDGWPGRGVVPSGMRMINDEWVDGALEFDPRIFFEFEWRGIDPSNAVPSDDLFFSMWGMQFIDADGLTRSAIVPNPGEPGFADWVQSEFDDGNLVAVTSEEWTTQCFAGAVYVQPGLRDCVPTDDYLVVDDPVNPLYAIVPPPVIVFPPFPFDTPVGDRDRFLLDSPFVQSYELGPFFFQPGDSATARLDFTRAGLASTSFSTDNADRFLWFDLRFIDTFDGFALFGGFFGEGFAFGTPASLRGPNDDADGDGFSNLLEYALLSDPSNSPLNDANGQPDFPEVKFEVADPALCSASINKRPNVGSSLIYNFQRSTDCENWTTITDNDDFFDVTEDDLTLSVALKPGVDPPVACFLRVIVRQD